MLGRVRNYALLIVAAAVLGGWLWTSSHPVLEVETATLSRGAVREQVEEEGRARVVERFVVSAPVDGRLARIGLEEGDPVRRGQVLADIDPLPLAQRTEAATARIASLRESIGGIATKKPKAEELERSRVLAEQARGEVTRVEQRLTVCRADLDQARREAERAARMRALGAATEEELEHARLAETAAAEALEACDVDLRVRRLALRAAELEADLVVKRQGDFDWEEAAQREQLRALEAELTILRDDLGRTAIRSPTDGVVLRVLEENATVLSAGTPVVEVGDLTHMEVEADFLSRDAARMRPGMPVEFFGGALGTEVRTGTVKLVRPQAFTKLSSLGVEQQRVTVIAALDTAPGVGDAYRLDVRVILSVAEDVVLVPESALFRHGGRWHVHRVVDGRARLTPVTPGIGDGRVRAVSSGVAAGDEVVLHPPAELEDGRRIAAVAR